MYLFKKSCFLQHSPVNLHQLWFHSPSIMCILGYHQKKCWMETPSCTNSKNVYKNICARLSWTSPPKKIHILFSTLLILQLCSVQVMFSSVIFSYFHQGSIHGPLIFSICVNNLPLILKSCQVQLYAVIYASNSVSIQIQLSLQSDFNMLQDWLLATTTKKLCYDFWFQTET